MNEQEWLACTNPSLMLDFLQDKGTDRKLRLFAVVCCQRIWELLPNDDCKRAVVAAERTADGHCDPSAMYHLSEIINASIGSLALRGEVEEYAAIAAGSVSSRDHIHMTDEAAAVAIAIHRSHETYRFERKAEAKVQPCLIRDIFGNPYRPVSIDPSWGTSTVLMLAAGIYEEKAFDRLPILADALQDAGCDEPAIHAHCFCKEPHVRGCWLIDSLLGKA